MHVKRIKKKDAVYLAQYETYREDGKVKTRFIKYLGKEGDERGVPLSKKSTHRTTPLCPDRSKRAGDLRLMWSIANETLNMPEIIDQISCGDGEIEGISPGRLLTAWAIVTALDPESTTSVSEWIQDTTILDLLELPEDCFTDQVFSSSLDKICFRDATADGLTDFSHLICEELYTRWRSLHPLPDDANGIVLHNLTPVLIFGPGHESGERGYNARKAIQKEINLCLLVSKWDKVPVSFFLLPGDVNSISSVKDLLLQLSIEPGTLVRERENAQEECIRDIEALGWNLICGMNTGSEEAESLLLQTHVPTKVSHKVRATGSHAVYATRAEGRLLGRKGAGIVFVNQRERVGFIDARNALVTELDAELQAYSGHLNHAAKQEVEEGVATILWEYADFFRVHILQKGRRCRVSWEYDEAAIDSAADLDGKHLLYSTDTDLRAPEVVKEFMERDFIETIFRTQRSHLVIPPARHWMDHRIRGIFLLNMMALWLRKVYEHQLNQVPEKKRSYGFDELLRRLKRVEYVEVISADQEMACWYLNLTEKMKQQLKAMGFLDLFAEKRLDQNGS